MSVRLVPSAFDELLRLLIVHGQWRDPNPSRALVTAEEHALQAATRAERGGYDDQHIVAALIHDAGRPLNDAWHGAVIAEIMRGRLDEHWYPVLRNHGVFQSDLMHGRSVADKWREEPWFGAAQRLAAWDAASFDPGYDSLPLEHFLPKLAVVMA